MTTIDENGTRDVGTHQPCVEHRTLPKWIEKWRWPLDVAIWLLILALFAYVFSQFCNYFSTCGVLNSDPIFCTYIAIGTILGLLLIDRWLRHTRLEQEARSVDLSTADSMVVEARALLGGGETGQLSSDADPYALEVEINRLRERIKDKCVLEYDVVQLEKLSAPFWPAVDLVESAREYLHVLEDYAEDLRFRYERDQFNKRKSTIEEAIQQVEKRLAPDSDSGGEAKPDDPVVKRLRAMVLSLIDHITEYQYSWGIGSAKIRALSIYLCTTVALLLFMGVLPLIHPNGAGQFTVFNWAVLGGAGAISASLRLLRREQAVEVGYSEGKQEVRKGMLGVTLGLVAGTIIYALTYGDLISGPLFPDFMDDGVPATTMDIAKSIFWALAAGYAFEKVFDRLNEASSNLS